MFFNGKSSQLHVHTEREVATLRKCANELEAALKASTASASQIEQLRTFAQSVMKDWPEYGCELDGCELQELAEAAGLLITETRTEPCGEVCQCEEYNGRDGFPVTCYRKTELLTGPLSPSEPTETERK